MAITPQERELVIIGNAVASGCKGCLRSSVVTAGQLHVTQKEIDDAIYTALCVRKVAAYSVETFVSSGFAETGRLESYPRRFDSQRVEALVSIGAAFSVNCVVSLQDQLEKAKTIGISEDEIDAVIGLSAFMKAMAASHVERLMSPYNVEDETDMLAEYGTPFGPERCAWAPVCKSNKALYRAQTQSSSAAGDDLIKIAGAL